METIKQKSLKEGQDVRDHITSSSAGELKAEAGKGVRLASLDFYRGLVMVFLALGYTGIYNHFIHVTTKGSFLRNIAIQFTHYPWHGLHLWDFVQPGFMFVAGVAMAFSITKQTAKGRSWGSQCKHALSRSWWLLFWGILIFAVHGNKVILDLTDVLTQLAFTLFITFLIFHWKPAYQILFTVGLLLLTEFLYRGTHIPGFDQPFTNFHNFGNYFDLMITGRMNPDGWVSINWVPTAAHTIWGAIAGKWLISLSNNKSKIKHIVIFGLVAMILGYGLDWLHITPIIKRISTSSFTLVTGGWCLLFLAFLYWWIDIKQHKKYLKFFVIVGMNSIFIYLFCQLPIHYWFKDYTYIWINHFSNLINLNHNVALLIGAIIIFAVEWYACYWLYKKKIFFKV